MSNIPPLAEMVPAVPLAGTADPFPLVTLNDYQRITTDTLTTEDEFNYFLADVLLEVQQKCNRTLLYAQYNERLFLYQNGMVYGTAVPYDVSKPVVNPASGNTPQNNVGIFQGYGIWVGWFIPLPSLPVWEGVVPPQTDITYWGGFVGPNSPLASGFLLPTGLKRAICKMIWYMANPAVLTGLPGGVKSMSVGGVAFSTTGGLSSMVTMDPSIAHGLKRFRRRVVRSFAGQITAVPT